MLSAPNHTRGCAAANKTTSTPISSTTCSKSSIAIHVQHQTPNPTELQKQHQKSDSSVAQTLQEAIAKAMASSHYLALGPQDSKAETSLEIHCKSTERQTKAGALQTRAPHCPFWRITGTYT